MMKRGAVEYGSAWALVTGAGSGIGRCYALQLAKLGYRVAIVGLDPEKLRAVGEELLAAGCAEVRTCAIDLARAEAAGELFTWSQAQEIAVEVLINNAGVFSFCDMLATQAQRVERIVMLHNLTVAQTCRLYAQEMVERGTGGYILNMSSYSQWMPFPGMALYGASKAFVRTFSVAFAKEVCDSGIRVTAVCPAGVATDLYGLPHRWQKIGRRLGVLISADNCARRGLKALWRGRRCIVPDWWNRLWIPLCKIAPMCTLRPLRKFTMKFQK